jgi:hypothetical protein
MELTVRGNGKPIQPGTFDLFVGTATYGQGPSPDQRTGGVVWAAPLALRVT